jgi:hypothetical protein
MLLIAKEMLKYIGLAILQYAIPWLADWATETVTEKITEYDYGRFLELKIELKLP